MSDLPLEPPVDFLVFTLGTSSGCSTAPAPVIYIRISESSKKSSDLPPVALADFQFFTHGLRRRLHRRGGGSGVGIF